MIRAVFGTMFEGKPHAYAALGEVDVQQRLAAFLYGHRCGGVARVRVVFAAFAVLDLRAEQLHEHVVEGDDPKRLPVVFSPAIETMRLGEGSVVRCIGTPLCLSFRCLRGRKRFQLPAEEPSEEAPSARSIWHAFL